MFFSRECEPRARKLHIHGAFVVVGATISDQRGYFREIFRTDEKYPREIQPQSGVQQISISHSVRDTLRGLHKSTYSKFVSVLSGVIYDVICDLRPESPTFCQWAAVRLSAENGRQLFIPPGVAHGFVCIQDATVLYVQGGVFNPPEEVDIFAFDKQLDIFWPAAQTAYIMSTKDEHAPPFRSAITPCRGQIRPSMRVLVIGGNGQLGRAVTAAHSTEHVVGTYNSRDDDKLSYQLNLEDIASTPQMFESFLELMRPHLVYICAGFTWVDGCELEPHKSEAVNSIAPGIIAKYSRRVGAKTVFYSTDYVFDGKVDKVWLESDEVNPLNTYGKSKLQGEQNVLTADPSALIIRTTGVFGPDAAGKNFIYQLCDALKSKKIFKCPTDQFGAPTYSVDLARISKTLVEKGASGVFHCVGSEISDRYSFALKVAEFCELPSELILPLTTEQQFGDVTSRLGTAALRGKYLGLQSIRLDALIPRSDQVRSIEEALKHWQDNLAGARLPWS